MSGPPGADRWHWLKHPLFLTLVAFALTTGLGTHLNISIQRNSDARALFEARMVAAQRDWENRSNAVNHITVAIFERAAITDLLRSAIGRRIEHEVMERKRTYDAIYLQWNGQMPETRATLRALDLGSDGAQLGYFNDNIVNVFAGLDQCVTGWFDRFLGTLDDKPIWQGAIKCRVAAKSETEDCPAIAGEDQLNWLRKCVIALRVRALEQEQQALALFEQQRQNDEVLAHCLYNNRIGLWRHLVLGDDALRNAQRDIATTCEGAP